MTSTFELSLAAEIQSAEEEVGGFSALPRVLERTYPWFHPQNCLREITSETSLKFLMRAPWDEGSEHGKGL